MDDNQAVSRKIVILGRKIRNKRNVFAKALSLTSEQADALRYFADAPRRTITDFKDYRQITHQTARLIVKRLVDRQLLQLEANPNDGRAKLVSLTAAGRVKWQQLDRHIASTSQTLFTGFTPEEQRRFLAMLDQISQNLEGVDVF
ncbi:MULTISPECIES: MarR family winged helix-turn-helix transcriptional regulator [Lactobacillaceae]|uniref:MarR family winged helix-turn-helix transcriptional regulator n=1 Tax=Lactobacillaceae TaxID=33958 RepID=UPI001457887B|nr:MarR family transcriptional regulator [Lactobacillus sp. HBUAS51381]NLR08571.1 MarR family transcriptional regulator [Lactobacillus sp. HBUAS51381]